MTPTNIGAEVGGRVHDAADMMANLLDEHSIVAGGAVRDLIRGGPARDIDVCTSPAGFEAARNRAAEQVGEDLCALADELDGGSATLTGLRAVVTYGVVQVICVDDPIARVGVFDAWCNMVWVDHKGDIWAGDSRTLGHIMAKRWEPRREAACTSDALDARRTKMWYRGWSVPTPDNNVRGYCAGFTLPVDSPGLLAHRAKHAKPPW